MPESLYWLRVEEWDRKFRPLAEIVLDFAIQLLHQGYDQLQTQGLSIEDIHVNWDSDAIIADDQFYLAIFILF